MTFSVNVNIAITKIASEDFPTWLGFELTDSKDHVVISTSEPYSIISTEGKTRFEISPKYLHVVE